MCVELGFMGNVLQVELPVGLDEQQMQTISSTPDLRKHQPVSAKPIAEIARLPTDFSTGIGRLTSRAVVTTDGIQCCDSPSLVNLGVPHSLRANTSFWNLANYDQSSNLVVTRFRTPGKNSNTLA